MANTDKKHHLQCARWSDITRNGEKGLRADFVDHSHNGEGEAHYKGAVANLKAYGLSEKEGVTRLDMNKVSFNGSRLQIDIIGDANLDRFKHWLEWNCPALHEQLSRKSPVVKESGSFQVLVGRKENASLRLPNGFDDELHRQEVKSKTR